MRIPKVLAENERLGRRILMALGVAVLLGCATRAILKPYDGDFKVHWETGRRFLAGEFLYVGGHDFPYPPLLGMIFAPAALLPMPVAKAVFYPVAVAALLLLVWIMRRLVQSSFRLTETQTFWATAFALFLAIQFVLRDQAEVGLNTAIAALIWLGIYLWRNGRDPIGGLSLSTAIAIKCTPALFLAYFVWKRQWQMVAATTVATVIFTAAPMVWQGPTSWTNHMSNWVGNATHGLTGGGSGVEKSERFRTANMSLRSVLMRYLAHVPNDAFTRHSDPPSVEFLDLSPWAASAIVNSILLILIAVFLWWSSGAVTTRDDPRVLWELAAAGVLMLLLSPITWSQHCVALLPACFVIAALVMVADRLPRWSIAVLLVYIVFCSVLGRDLLPRNVGLWLTGLHVSTFCFLGLFAILLAGPRLQRSASSNGTALPEKSGFL